MGKLEDLTGQRFGKLTVLGRAGTYKWPSEDFPEFQSPTWHCRCDCGKETIVIGNNLRSGGSRSCGCTRRGNSGRPARRAGE